MIQKIKRHKNIVSNTFYLSLIQVLTLVSPLLALPYIISTVGKDNYGLIVFAQSIAAYSLIIINFGLDLSAVKDISQNRNDKKKLSEIVSSVLSVKSILLLVSAALYAILILLVPKFKANYILFVVVFLPSISEVLFPIWYYQGVERMATLTVVKSTSLIFYLSTLFFVVTKESDYIYVPLLQSIGIIISSFIGLIMLKKVEKIKFIIPEKQSIITTFKDSVPFFFSRVSVVINSNIAQTVSGVFLGMGDVAVFDIAKKIINFALIPLQMLMQAVFPHNANKQNVNFVRNFLYIITIMVFVEIIGIYFLAPYVVYYFGGQSLMQAVTIVRILLVYLLFGAFSTYLGAPVLVAFGYYKPFNISVFISTTALLFCYCLYYLFDVFTLPNFAIALIVAEFAMFLYRYYYCKKYQLI